MMFGTDPQATQTVYHRKESHHLHADPFLITTCSVLQLTRLLQCVMDMGSRSSGIHSASHHREHKVIHHTHNILYHEFQGAQNMVLSTLLVPARRSTFKRQRRLSCGHATTSLDPYATTQPVVTSDPSFRRHTPAVLSSVHVSSLKLFSQYRRRYFPQSTPVQYNASPRRKEKHSQQVLRKNSKKNPSSPTTCIRAQREQCPHR